VSLLAVFFFRSGKENLTTCKEAKEMTIRRAVLMAMLMRSSLCFRVVLLRHHQRPRIRQPCLCMSTSVTENGDEALDGILEEVEDLLSDLSHKNQVSSTNDGWRSIDWDTVSTTSQIDYPSTAFKVASKKDLLSSSRLPSPVEKILVKDRIVYLKRDDLLRLPGSGVSGNKARKLYSLNEMPSKDFPNCVVSYGGPQSNAMVALAAIVHSKNYETRSEEMNTADETSGAGPQTDSQPSLKDAAKKRFVYYTKNLPRFLRNQPNGNLYRAQTLGMELVELTHAEYNNLFGSETGGRPEPPADLAPPVSGDSLWVSLQSVTLHKLLRVL